MVVHSNMQTTQDAPAEILFKLWPWLEANKTKIIAVTGVIVVAVGIYYFVASQREENEIAAGSALTQLLMTPPSPNVSPADALAKLAERYPGTAAAQRAQLASAASLFGAAKYPEAAAAFQKFADANSGSQLVATALLGLGASQEAQNKLDLAAPAYQRVASTYSSTPSALPALCGLGRIAEAQGKLKEALDRYESAARAGQAGGSMAQEAAIRASELRVKVAAMTPKATAPAAAPMTAVPTTAPAAK